MALVSVIQAAKLAKVSRKTIYKYLDQGKISSSKDRNGNTEIDVSELQRVFGNLPGAVTQGDTSGNIEGDTGGRKVTNGDGAETPQEAAKSPAVPVETLVENAKLKAENDQLRERLAEASRDKEMLFARLSEAQASIKLLTHTPEPDKEKKGFWARLMGR